MRCTHIKEELNITHNLSLNEYAGLIQQIHLEGDINDEEYELLMELIAYTIEVEERYIDQF